MLSQEQLKVYLTYCPDTGLFTKNRYKDPRGRFWGGYKIGAKNVSGYIFITINKKQYLGHRLAWFYMTGEWPESQIDHINGVRTDNKIENLRKCSPMQNRHNVGITKTNKSGFKGVSWNKDIRKWTASVSINNKTKVLGYFYDKGIASKVYQDFCKANHNQFFYDSVKDKNLRNFKSDMQGI